MKRIVLASASPRRRALLSALGIPFDVIPSKAVEQHKGSPEQMVLANARAKRDEVAYRLSGHAVVIAADTLVFLDSHVLSKPQTIEEAKDMLERLSGKTHTVMTGLSLTDTGSGRCAEGHEATQVTFRTLDRKEIVAFVEAVCPLDRAGAYTVDGPGSLLVERYEGCYQNVLGLPVVRLDRLLREIGVNLFEEMRPEHAAFL